MTKSILQLHLSERKKRQGQASLLSVSQGYTAHEHLARHVFVQVTKKCLIHVNTSLNEGSINIIHVTPSSTNFTCVANTKPSQPTKKKHITRTKLHTIPLYETHRLVLVAVTKLGVTTNTTCPGISGAASRFLAAALNGLTEGVLIASACHMISTHWDTRRSNSTYKSDHRYPYHTCHPC
jgi:hypothetical protein